MIKNKFTQTSETWTKCGKQENDFTRNNKNKIHRVLTKQYFKIWSWDVVKREDISAWGENPSFTSYDVNSSSHCSFPIAKEIS